MIVHRVIGFNVQLLCSKRTAGKTYHCALARVLAMGIPAQLKVSFPELVGDLDGLETFRLMSGIMISWVSLLHRPSEI